MASVARYYNMDRKVRAFAKDRKACNVVYLGAGLRCHKRGWPEIHNWFIKRTGNKSALMYFGINDSKAFAKKCGVILIEEKTFFPEALSMLGKKLNLVSKVSMEVADDKKRVIILHIRLL